MTNPNPAYAQPDPVLPAGDDPDEVIIDWIFRNLAPDDPVELRRSDLLSWSVSAGFTDIAVRYKTEANVWEMDFNRGANDELTTAAQVRRWIGFIARGCGCQIVPGLFAVTLDGDRIASQFRLDPRLPTQPAA
jgi:hypothetical protein